MARHSILAILCALLPAFGQTPFASAAAPTMEYVYPSGGSRGTTATVTITGALDPWPVQVWCSRPELQIKPTDDKGKLAITIPAECAPGIAWLRLYNAEGASAVRPFVIGTLPEVEEAEPNNEQSKAQSLASSTITVNGKHQAAHDVDMFAVNLKAGQTVIADLQAKRSLGAPSDPVLQLVSPSGFVMEQNDDDQGLDPRLAVTVPADGTYYVRTFAFPAATDSAINFAGGASWLYRLTITTDRFTDYVLPLAVTRAAAGEVEARGWNLGAEPLKVAVPAADADHVTLVIPQSGNALTIPTSAHPEVVELEPNLQAQPQPVPVPGGISGIISAADDLDYFRFTAKKGEPVLVKVVAREQGSLIDPVVVILNADGKELQRIDDKGVNADPELTWNPPADGDYLLSVADLHHRGGARFYYHVDLTHPKADYAATVAADSFVLAVDKPLEIPITIERLHGFKDEIEFTATGLPEGVAVTPVKSLAEGDTAKTVKLVLTGNVAAFSGPLQIVGTSVAEPKLARTPKFKLTQYDLDAEQLWLTVIKK